MTTPPFIDKGPSIDWSTDENLHNRFKIWKQRCELLFTGTIGKIDEVKCKHICGTGRESKALNYSTAGICHPTNRKSLTTTGKDLKISGSHTQMS